MEIFFNRCFVICFLVYVVSVLSEDIQDRLNLIREINSAQDLWEAEENAFLHQTDEELKALMGFRKKPKDRIVQERSDDVIISSSSRKIPVSFDARTEWPSCHSIGAVKDQSNCGSCWAVSTAAAVSDRICIASNFTIRVNISAEALMSCCSACTDGDPGCEGGYLDEAWKYCKWHGLVTGGDYASNEGCQPYGIKPCAHCSEEATTPKCYKKKCTNKKYHKKYKKDLHKLRHYYSVDNNITAIQLEILHRGPLITGFMVYRDFMQYKKGWRKSHWTDGAPPHYATAVRDYLNERFQRKVIGRRADIDMPPQLQNNCIYHHTTGSFLGNHAVRIIGWGRKNKTPYWLVANSWNSTWGDKGFFKIIRGKNECDFEANVFAGTAIPK